MVLQFGPNVLVLVHSGYSSRTPQTKLFINNRNFLQFWRLEEHDQGTGRSGNWWEPDLLHCSQIAFSFFPHMLEETEEFFVISFARALIPLMRAPPSWSNHLQVPPHHLLIPSVLNTFGIRLQLRNLGGQTYSVHNISTLDPQNLTSSHEKHI